MPTPVAHSLAGLAIHWLSANPKSRLVPNFRETEAWVRIGLCAFFASLADTDFLLGFLVGRNLHHHFTHSLGFTVLVGAALLVAYQWKPKWFLASPAVLTLCYLSHLGLDLFSKDTSPPFGMQLLWPVTERYVIGPFILFNDVWRGSLAKLFGWHNWMAVGQEILVLSPILAVCIWLRRSKP